MIQTNKSSYKLDEADLVNQLYGNAFSGLIITAIAYFAVVIVASGTAPQILSDTLKYSMGLLLTLRAIDYTVWRVRGVNPKMVKAQKKRFKVLTIATGVLWATAACSLHQFQSIELKYFTLLTLGSMTGGSVNVLSGSRLLATLYPTFLLLPISLLSIFSDVQSIHVVGILGSAYWIIMVNVSRRSAKSTRETIQIKNEQIALRSLVETESASLKSAYEELSVTQNKLHQANVDLESKVKQRTAEIYRLSNLDPLTGLYNRTAFLDALEHQVASNASVPLSIIFIDLTGFKNINDTLGHHTGDFVLSEIGKRLKGLLSAKAVCRWGGDEFVLFTDYHETKSTLQFAADVLALIEQPIQLEDQLIELSASLGVSLYPEHDSAPHRLIEQADLAMYTNKKNESDHAVFYTDALRDEINLERKRLEGLRQGLEKQQFILHYQPILLSDGNQPWGVEALLRWKFEDKVISPQDFIPLAERTGLICEIGAWVLESACQQAMDWQHAKDAHISINVSVVQLKQQDFFDSVISALDKSGLPAHRLHLEVTETLFFEASNDALRALDKLRKLGVGVSIDDFGTGYSSLSQIQQLPTDCIKIDKAFIADLDGQIDVIIRAALLVSNEYSFSTVAEGVETLHQLEKLKLLGVDLLQGFYFSKPLEASALDRWWSQQDS